MVKKWISKDENDRRDRIARKFVDNQTIARVALSHGTSTLEIEQFVREHIKRLQARVDELEKEIYGKEKH